MAKLGKVIAGLGAVAGGYMKGEDMIQRQRRDEEEQQARRDERKRAEEGRLALAQAVTPTAVEEVPGLEAKPATMDDRDVGQPGEQRIGSSSFRAAGQSFDSREAADAAAAGFNSPEATDKRVSLALAKSGDVVGAKRYEASAAELAEKSWRRQLGGAIQKGHDGLAEFVTRSGGDGLAPHRLKAVPSEDGKQVTYHKVNEDGSTTPTRLTFSNDQDGVIRAAYMLDRGVTPEQRYSNMVAEDKQRAAGAAKERELELRERELQEVKIPNAETRARLAEVQAALAELRGQRAGAGGADKVSREERLRYTALFEDEGRRLSEAQRSLNTLRRDPLWSTMANRPGTPQAQEMADLQSQIARHTEGRSLYQSLLAGQGGKAPALGDAGPGKGKPAAAPAPAPAANKPPVKVATKAERDKLEKGTRYVGPDGQTYVKQ
jgi:hypothetical protein